MKGKIRTVIFLLLMLVILPCGAMYYLYSGAMWNISQREMLGEYGELSAFSMMTEQGEELTRKDLHGKVVIADFFTNSDKENTSKKIEELKKVAHIYQESKNILILSHSTQADAGINEMAQLKSENEIKTPFWHFLSGDETEILRQAEVDYHLDLVDHSSQKFALVDTSGTVVNYYDINVEEEVLDLLRHITLILPANKKASIEYKPIKEK